MPRYAPPKAAFFRISLKDFPVSETEVDHGGRCREGRGRGHCNTSQARPRPQDSGHGSPGWDPALTCNRDRRAECEERAHDYPGSH
jgi:hypothetical protein